MILNSPYITGSITVTGNANVQGTLTVTGSLSGTATSASLALNSNLLQGTGSVGFSTTASLLAVSSSQQQISSSLLQVSASYISLSGSYTTFSGSASTRITANSSSIQQISSSQQQISSSLLNVIANYATTGSNSFRADQSITGSLVVSSTITAQTLVVQTVTSSIVYSSGSNIFGSALGDRQTFTGSLNVTGSNHNIFGNVGIGTTNPSGLFQVGVANSGIYFDTTTQYTPKIKAAGTISDIQIESVGSGGNVYLTAPGATSLIAMSVNGSEKLRITAAGNVGIGITSPQTNLSVKGIAANATASTYNGIFGLESVNQTSFQMGIGSTYNGTWFQSFNQPATGGGTYPLIFNPLGGNVGIGTTSPTAKLEVRGTADGDLFIGRFHAGSAKLIYAYQLGSDGYLELRTGADAIITKLSGYTGTPSYFLSNVGINTTGSNSRVTIVDNNVPNASGNITSGTQFAASIASGFASLNLGAYDDGGSTRYGYLRTAYSDNAGVPSEMRFYTAATERMRISTGGIVTQPYQPAFSIANGAALTGPGTVPFKNVIFDDGSNFNTTTYRFTAPVAGRYFFSFYDNIYANVAPSPSMEFRVNGTRRGAIAYTNTKTIGYWYIMSFQQVIKLSSGDYVEVYIAAADSPDYGGDYSWGNFSGFLIG